MDSMQQNLEQFLVAKNGRKLGPYSKEMLIENIRLGHFTFDDLVWKPPMKGWEPMHQHISKEELTQVEISTAESNNPVLVEPSPSIVVESNAPISNAESSPPRSPHETSGALGQLFNLHSNVSNLAILIDVMIFVLLGPTVGLALGSIPFVIPLLAIITFLTQKNQCGDSLSEAISKTLTVVLLTAIPVPVCTALIIYFRFFKK